jgi:hypothetical protein
LSINKEIWNAKSGKHEGKNSKTRISRLLAMVLTEHRSIYLDYLDHFMLTRIYCLWKSSWRWRQIGCDVRFFSPVEAQCSRQNPKWPLVTCLILWYINNFSPEEKQLVILREWKHINTVNTHRDHLPVSGTHDPWICSVASRSLYMYMLWRIYKI